MTAGSPGGRDRYIDCLRAVALVRVVVYHTFSWVWLPLVFPSMPIMFALAGALVASSLDRSRVNPWPVLGRRIRRLLPPVWALGLVAVPLMLVVGWTSEADRGLGSPLTWDSLLLWVVPLSEPPGSAWGYDWSEPLWYLATYLWLLLLSPSLLWLFRRWPLRTLAVPLLAVVAGTAGLWSADDRAGKVALDLATFGACWMLGFAHHDNRIRPISLKVILPTSLVLLAAGLSWALHAPNPVSGPNVDDIPLADALWGVGAVLLLLRLYPDFGWLARISWLDKAIAAVNSRAMTIYLWGNPAIFVAAPLISLFPLTLRLDDNPVVGPIQYLAVTFALIVVAVFVFGWVEDVAARRRPRLNPWPRDAVDAGAHQGAGSSQQRHDQRQESAP